MEPYVRRYVCSHANLGACARQFVTMWHCVCVPPSATECHRAYYRNLSHQFCDILAHNSHFVSCMRRKSFHTVICTITALWRWMEAIFIRNRGTYDHNVRSNFIVFVFFFFFFVIFPAALSLCVCRLSTQALSVINSDCELKAPNKA